MSAVQEPYRARLMDRPLADAIGAFAAVMLTGPRAVGKTTSAARFAKQIDRLDVPDVAALYRADPDAALRRAARPLLLDEWQEVPEVLGAVKRAVDSDPTPGQFLLTGSIRATTELSTWAGTGRVVRLTMYPLAEREIESEVDSDASSGLVGRLGIADWLGDIPSALPALSIDDYIQKATRGSFPELAFRDRTLHQRDLWLESYIDDLVSRDIQSIGLQRDPVLLRRFLTTLALNTAGTPTDASLLRDANLTAKTAAAYERALTNLVVTQSIPAWSSNRLKRLTKGVKRYLIDTALAASVASVTTSEVITDSDLRGRWFDTFAAMQIRAELSAASPRRSLHHLRVEGGRHEVDMVLDMGRGRLFGIECKSGAAPTLEDARHLVWLREELGKNFVGGVIFHTGQAVVELSERIAAVPLSAMWASGG